MAGPSRPMTRPVSHPEIGSLMVIGLSKHGHMRYDVRRVRADEWPQYRELRLEALKDSPLAFVEQYDDVVARPEQFWRDRVERSASGEASCTFVAVVGSRFVGKASCFVETDVADHVSAHVVGVYVSPEMRGTGLAEPLLGATIRWAHEDARADRIRLFVMETNLRAIAFYQRLGFIPTGATMPYPPDPTRTEIELKCHRRSA